MIADVNKILAEQTLARYCKNRNIPLLELSYKEINSLTIDDLKERIENLWQKR